MWVRHRLAAHAALPSLGHGGDAVRGQRFLLAVSSVLRLHHGVSIVLLLLLLLTAGSVGEIGTSAARLDGRRKESRRVDREKDRREEGFCKSFLSLCTLSVPHACQ